MPRLLAAEAVFLQQHFFQYIPVAHLCGYKIHTVFFTKTDKPHIGHNGAYHRVFSKFPPGFHIQGANRHNKIAVYQVSLIVYRKAAVRVAVKGYAGIQMVLLNKSH